MAEELVCYLASLNGPCRLVTISFKVSLVFPGVELMSVHHVNYKANNVIISSSILSSSTYYNR